MKILLVEGGLRIGDCFHFIPLIDSLKNDEITWISGTYEMPATELIKKHFPQIKELISIHDATPGNFNDRINFKNTLCKISIDKNKFDRIIDDPTLSFEWGSPNVQFTLKKESYFPSFPREDYICLHSKSISDWKNRDIIVNTTYPLPIKLLDGLTAMDEAFDLISRCRFLVGIHSAMACLSVYCNTPLICCGTGPTELRFSNLRDTNIDLDNPSEEQLQEAIKEMMLKTEKKS